MRRKGPIGVGRAGEYEMGKVVRFPGAWQAARRRKSAGKKAESAIVIILPVVRIERFSDTPPEGEPMRQGRRRRRRAART
jgi:hypothetical protein